MSYRDTWAEVSLSHIGENVSQFRQFVAPETRIMAIVKADGYGHGGVQAARAALQAGAAYLGVALLDEAIELREAEITAPILVLGYIPPRSIAKAVAAEITMTVFDEEVLQEIERQTVLQLRVARIHLKIDTGMSRIGVPSKEAALSLALQAVSAPFVELEGIFTHFANADGEDTSYTYKQFHQFLGTVEYLKQHHIVIPIQHCCNSAATMRFPDMHLNMVRVGIALYGLYPDPLLYGHTIQLKQAMTLKTKIALVKTIPPHQPVSYGCTYEKDEERRIATLPIGYADGVSRLLSNRGSFLVQGVPAQIAGRVCMDQLMLDVTHLPSCETGEEAILFGESNGAFQSMDAVASLMGTISYEVACLIGKRVPRVYI